MLAQVRYPGQGCDSDLRRTPKHSARLLKVAKSDMRRAVIRPTQHACGRPLVVTSAYAPGLRRVGCRSDGAAALLPWRTTSDHLRNDVVIQPWKSHATNTSGSSALLDKATGKSVPAGGRSRS